MEARSAKKRTSSRLGEGELLDQIFDQAPSYMAITTGPGHALTKINRRFAKLIARSENVVGLDVGEALPAAREQGLLGLLDTVYRRGEAHTGTEVVLRVPGDRGTERQLLIDFACRPLLDHAGQVQGLLVQGFDVSAKQLAWNEVENERKNFRGLLSQTPEMVMSTTGPTHVFDYVNQAHIRALGFNATGLSVREAQPESGEVHTIFDGVYRTGNNAELREIAITVAARVRYFSLTCVARRSPGGEINGLMMLGLEISDRKETERKLEEAVRVRDEFISVASHELKTPVTALKLQTDLTARKIRRGVSGALDSESMLRILDGSNRQLDQLTRLIEDMLDVARLATGRLKLDLKPVNLAEVAREAFEAFAPQFKLMHVTAGFDASSDPAVNVDVFRIEQVLTNLLSNALKYGNRQPVQVEVGTHGGEAFIRVTDRGIGMETGVQAAVFERFARAVCDRSVSGLGLGLYIGRQIVQSHGGRIEVQSELGRGSSFTVILPVRASGDAP